MDSGAPVHVFLPRLHEAAEGTAFGGPSAGGTGLEQQGHYALGLPRGQFEDEKITAGTPAMVRWFW